MKHGLLILGPAGSGKSTFSAALSEHMQSQHKRNRPTLVNLDPAAEDLSYTPDIDVRDLISADDAAEAMGLGPNGSLVFCMEYLVDNLEWLVESLQQACPSDHEYVIFDCPGQIELFTHIPVFRRVIRTLEEASFRIGTAFLVE